MNRQTGHLAGDVPHGYIHGPNSVGRYRPVALPPPVPDGPTVGRVRPNDGGFDEFDERPGVGIGTLSRGAEKGMALDSFVGVHGDHPKEPVASERPSPCLPRLALPV